MQQRNYDPQIGRFLSNDPVSTNPNTGDMFNRYNYANNNPYRFTDPDGRKPAGCGSGECKEKTARQRQAEQAARNRKLDAPYLSGGMMASAVAYVKSVKAEIQYVGDRMQATAGAAASGTAAVFDQAANIGRGVLPTTEAIEDGAKYAKKVARRVGVVGVGFDAYKARYGATPADQWNGGIGLAVTASTTSVPLVGVLYDFVDFGMEENGGWIENTAPAGAAIAEAASNYQFETHPLQ